MEDEHRKHCLDDVSIATNIMVHLIVWVFFSVVAHFLIGEHEVLS